MAVLQLTEPQTSPWWSRPLPRRALLGATTVLVYLAFGRLAGLGAAIVSLILLRYLARASPRRTLRFTRQGKYFVAITLGVGFAAINTGNNLLFLVLGMQLSLIVASGMLSEHVLRGLDAGRTLPLQATAGQPFLTGVRVHNAKTRTPSFSVQLEDHLIAEGAADEPLVRRCYFLKIPAQESRETSYRAVLPRRGAYTYSASALSTRFPFSFFVKTRQTTQTARLLVWPKISPIAQLPPAAQALVGESTSPQRGPGQDLYGLRRYEAGDDARAIHWKRTATAGQLMVREFAADRSHVTHLWLNCVEGPAAELSAEFDQCVDLCASLLSHISRAGHRVTVYIHGREWVVAPGGRGLEAVLNVLAEICVSSADVPSVRVPAGTALITPASTRNRAPAAPFGAVFSLGAG